MTDRYERQSFLGRDAAHILANSVVAIAGIGGGGSHIAQQLAHIGFLNLRLYDGDTAELSNLNRLIGASLEDVQKETKKVDIARRMMLAINPQMQIETFASNWQQEAQSIREADVVISCVDSYAARQDIEATARRFLIPLLDIGMDVHLVEGRPHISGQVILSLPGGPCMKCLGFLNDKTLQQEAEKYGAAGGRPQVVWTNGVLASIAVGLVVDLLTAWNGVPTHGEYLHFDGNTHEISRSPRIQYAPTTCVHFPADAVGEPLFQ
jgi:molybdopterin/thiamine biosynthesis adenylyltransferase